MTTTTKKTEKATTDRNNSFAMLISDYELRATLKDLTGDNIAPFAQSRKDHTKALQELAQALVYSVLKKCINVSSNKELENIRRTVARDTNDLDNLHRIAESNYKGAYNDNGDYYTEIIDKEADKAVTQLIHTTLGDGIDLVQECICAILTETAKAKERNNGTLSPTFMTDTYTVRRLKRKVYIQTAESAKGWETVETTAIQECYKAVRRCIEAQRSARTATNGYTYLEDLAKDSESDAESVIYRRFGKYADIGGAVVDYNGKETAYTTDSATAEKIDNILESLNLTAKQAKVLQLRQSGYGQRAIATYLGISHQAVAKTLKAIQTKATAINFTPESVTAD